MIMESLGKGIGRLHSSLNIKLVCKAISHSETGIGGHYRCYGEGNIGPTPLIKFSSKNIKRKVSAPGLDVFFFSTYY